LAAPGLGEGVQYPLNRKALDYVARTAKTADVPCKTIQLDHDQPYQAINGVANDQGCALMASHGRSGISAMLLGSVTNKVLAHTKIPVLVCH
jgi:nucleotide-binding universal stress UspA family protein